MQDDERQQFVDVLRMQRAEPATLEERIRAIEDRQEIYDLIVEYGWLSNFRLWDDLLDRYDDDMERRQGGSIEGMTRGKENFRASYERPTLRRRAGTGPEVTSPDRLGSYEFKHLISSVLIKLQGDKASAVARYVLSAEESSGEETKRGSHDGSYVYRFRRTPEGWKFTYQLCVTENASNPLFAASH